MSDYLEVSEFKEFLNQLNAEQDQQTQQLMKYTDGKISELDGELRQLISDLQIGYMVWNVTIGKYSDSVTAIRDLFNDVTVHAVTVDTLANLDMDVDGLAGCGLNVRGLAVYSGYLIGEDFTPEGIMYDDASNDNAMVKE